MTPLAHTFDPQTLGVARGILDHQLIDCHGTRCGKVDDVLLHERDGTLVVAGISTGPGASERRVRTGMSRWIITRFGRHETWIDWQEVTGLTDHITLARTAGEYGLSRGETWAARLITRLPWRTLDAVQQAHLAVPDVTDESTRPREPVIRLSSVLGAKLRRTDGERLGTVHELVARNDDGQWVVTDVEVGAASLVARLGLPFRPTRRHDPKYVVSWDSDPLQFEAP